MMIASKLDLKPESFQTVRDLQRIPSVGHRRSARASSSPRASECLTSSSSRISRKQLVLLLGSLFQISSAATASTEITNINTDQNGSLTREPEVEGNKSAKREETLEERKARVGQEVQREYERQLLHEELQQRTRDFVDSMWQSLE